MSVNSDPRIPCLTCKRPAVLPDPLCPACRTAQTKRTLAHDKRFTRSDTLPPGASARQRRDLSRK